MNENQRAIDAAGAWVRATTGARVEASLLVSGVPFAFDGKELLTTMEELKARYQKVAKDKGARTIEPDSIAVLEDPTDERHRYTGPPQDTITVLMEVAGERIAVFVRRDDFKVVGFTEPHWRSWND